MEADRAMIEFYAVGDALVAYSTRDGLAPQRSRIQRADPPVGPWRTVYEADAQFRVRSASAGRMALIEHRAAANGGGAYAERVVVIDLGAGAAARIDEYALSAATFRGGGGAPRRPAGAVALGPGAVAWTRLSEEPGGMVAGELRVATLADPAGHVIVGTSREWIAPIAVDVGRVVYVVAGAGDDELRVRDLVSGADRVLARGGAVNSSVVAGDFALWLERRATPAADVVIQAVELGSGTTRTIEAAATNCGSLTAGVRYVAAWCGPGSYRIFDVTTLDPSRIAPPLPGVGVQAADGGLIWFDVSSSARRVVLFRPV